MKEMKGRGNGVAKSLTDGETYWVAVFNMDGTYRAKQIVNTEETYQEVCYQYVMKQLYTTEQSALAACKRFYSSLCDLLYQKPSAKDFKNLYQVVAAKAKALNMPVIDYFYEFIAEHVPITISVLNQMSVGKGTTANYIELQKVLAKGHEDRD